MQLRLKQIIFVVLLCLLAKKSSAELKLCITNHTSLTSPDVNSACVEIGTERCIVETSPVSCIDKIEGGIANVAIVQPEEAILGSMFTTENTTVIGYLRPFDEAGASKFSTIVLTNNDVKLDNFNELRYCHVGAEAGLPLTFLRDFEYYVWRTNNVNYCRDKEATPIENYFYNLNATFGPSCVPGRWSFDDQLDSELKKRFPKLLELCTAYGNETNPFIGSLNCLASGKGNIAISTLENFISYRKEQKIPDEAYRYVCTDGRKQLLNNTCVWFKYPWPLLISNKQTRDSLRLRESFPEDVWESDPTNWNDTEKSDLDELLSKILFSNSSTFHLVDTVNLNAYIQNSRNVSVAEVPSCRQGFRWCTVDEEQTKQCLLLQKASELNAIEPRIESCTKIDDSDPGICLKSIMQNKTDITFITSDLLYYIRQPNISNLEVALYTKDGHNDLKRSLLIVNSTVVKEKDDLRNKKACFSEYGSIDWVSYIYAFKDQIQNDSCNYYESLSKFLNDSCLPGAALRDESAITSHLCRLCKSSPYYSLTATNCNANHTENEYAGNRGALTCLKDGTADYAVLQLERDLELPKNLMVMCKNGTLANTLDVDDDCFLAVSPSGAIIFSGNNKFKNSIRQAFKEIEALSSYPSVFPFNPFIPYDGVYLFGKSTKGFYGYNLSSPDVPKYIKEHSTLIESIDTCVGRSKVQTPGTNGGTGESSGSTATTVVVIVVVVGIVGATVFGWFKYKNRSSRTNGQNRNDQNQNETEMVNMRSNPNRTEETEEEQAFIDRNDKGDRSSNNEE